MDAGIERDIARFLAECRTASLATVDDDGRPHAANVQFVCDEAWRFCWVSSAASAHSRHLAVRPDAAVTVYAHDDRSELIHGVQVHGRVEALADAGERAAALAGYVGKFPFVAEGAMRRAVDGQVFYRLTPGWLRWIDNRRGFGFKAERRW